jgi:dihydroxyacid dehydratase/phosphogluconate dehydratase
MTRSRRRSDDLRSSRWFGPDDLRSFGHRSRLMQMGLDPADWEGKPIIGILNTWSEFNPCHSHFRERAEHVKRGVDEAELEVRRAAWVKPELRFHRGWGYMFQRHVTQANEGRDFDHLTRDFGPAVDEPAIN